MYTHTNQITKHPERTFQSSTEKNQKGEMKNRIFVHLCADGCVITVNVFLATKTNKKENCCAESMNIYKYI